MLLYLGKYVQSVMPIASAISDSGAIIVEPSKIAGEEREIGSPSA